MYLTDNIQKIFLVLLLLSLLVLIEKNECKVIFNKVRYGFKNGTCPAEFFGNQCHICSCLTGKDMAYCTFEECYKEDDKADIYEYVEGKCPDKFYKRNCQLCACNEYENRSWSWCTIGDCKKSNGTKITNSTTSQANNKYEFMENSTIGLNQNLTINKNSRNILKNLIELSEKSIGDSN